MGVVVVVVVVVGQEGIEHPCCLSIAGILHGAQGLHILDLTVLDQNHHEICRRYCSLVSQNNLSLPSRMTIDSLLVFQAGCRHSYKQLGYVSLA